MSVYNDYIFRDYDIRGVYGVDFDESFAYDLGFTSHLFAKEGRIVIGHDFRNGSDSLSVSFSNGARDAGYDVIDIGAVPVPVLYYSTKHLSADIGVMITASHLPPNWNGFKFCDRNGIPISADTGLNDIRLLMGHNRNVSRSGSLTSFDILNLYSDHITSLINIHRRLRIVFDYGDSVTSIIVPKIAKKLNIDYYEINNSINAEFQNRTSELTPSSMSKLKDTVIRLKADIGIAYDGDGDRMGLIDKEGHIYYSGNEIIQLFCLLMSSAIKNKNVIYDLTCSRAVRDTILEFGGKPIESKVGQAHIAKLAIANNAIFGGQYSSHMCFLENGYMDDAVYSSFKILDLLSSYGSNLVVLNRFIKEYPHTEIENIPVEEKKKQAIIEKIDALFRNKGYSINRFDGLKIETNDSWCLIRPSNTSPLIRVNAEGRTMEEALNLHKVCTGIVKEAIKSD